MENIKFPPESILMVSSPPLQGIFPMVTWLQRYFLAITLETFQYIRIRKENRFLPSSRTGAGYNR